MAEIKKSDVSFVSPYRSSRPDVFCEKGVLRNFAKFTGKHLCQSLFLNKVAGLRSKVQVFPCKFCEISKNTFLHRTHLVAASSLTLKRNLFSLNLLSIIKFLVLLKRFQNDLPETSQKYFFRKK